MDEIVNIELFGELFRFKAEPGVTDAVKIAEYLSESVTKVEKQFAAKSPEISKLALLVMASLNISKELFELKNEHEELLNRISERSERLITRMEDLV